MYSEDSVSKLEIIKDNSKKVLKNNSKFYIFLLTNKKAKLLADGNKENNVISNSEDELIKMVNVNKLEKLDNLKNIYMLTIRKAKADDKIEGFDSVGGRLVITVSNFYIKYDKDKKKTIKFINLDNKIKKTFALSQKYWLNDRYLKKYDIVSVEHMKKIFRVLFIGSPFAARKMTDVIKKELPQYLKK